MAILFGAGEDEAIDVLNGSMDDTPGLFDPAYARGAIRVHGFPGAQHRFRGDLKTYLDGQPDDDKDFWYSFVFKGSGGFLGGLSLMYMYDTNGVAAKPFLRLVNHGPGELKLGTSPDGGTWTDYLASVIAQPPTPKQMALRIKIHPTLGMIQWFFDNALWFQTVPGDTTGLAAGSPSKVLWGCPNSNDVAAISEIMAATADHPLPGLRLFTADYTALGALTGWSGPVENVNELVKNVATAQSTAAAGTDVSFVPRPIPALADGIVIHAVIVSGEFRTAPDPAPQHVIGGLRIGGVVYPGPMQLVDSVAALLQWIWHTNPASEPDSILVGDFNALQTVHRSVA